MPTKAHRPGLVRTHSRSSSGGTSKVALNLQLTQKEVVQPKVDKGKQRNGHVYEGNARSTSAFPRTGSTVRVQSREHVPSAAQKRGPPPAPPARPPPQPTKHKGGFTLAASSNGSDDEDEWVSSESGAATPNKHHDSESDDSDAVTEPVEPPQQPTYGGIEATLAIATTPRAESPLSRPRNATNHDAAVLPQPSKLARTASASRVPPPDPRPRTPEHKPQIDTVNVPPPADVPSGARTEPATPTSPTSPGGRHSHVGRRVRPPSTHSLASSKLDFSHPLRPHPLIRGQSYGHAHLAPLTVMSESAQAQLQLGSSPPPSHRGNEGQLSSSPTSIRTASVQTSPRRGTLSNASLRRPSTSSARSVATLPVQPMTQISRTPPDRMRTMSTISQSSSSAALSSLAHLPTATRPATPHMTAYFPQQNPHVHPESIHVLLPSPYVTPHLTVLQWRNPIRESYDRVSFAKQRKRGSS
ncbi:hypothetical protein FA95DRAFT_249171 [Auriscalpium vulgare]|uniref:Uncharacterized protein n=1 Tax=Auriscalpium vulgare TaxID=40419 RepID=A0ACB8RK89_9AGAM|nr:hypothetical protein FA95DRAFT_249171 [Auriscalpium vulgare]